MKPFKTNSAIIGIGRWGKNLLREFNALTPVTVCVSKNSEKHHALFAHMYPEIEHTTSLERALTDQNINAIVIATPPETHYLIARAALEAGKHAFVEKPMTMRYDQTKRLVEISKAKKRILFEGHIYVYHPVFQKLCALLKNDPPVAAEFHLEKTGTFESDVVYNHAAHDIAVAISLFGTPRKIQLLSQIGSITKRDIVSFRLDFLKNRHSIITVNRISPKKHKSVTIKTKKNLYVWEGNVLFRWHPQSEQFSSFFTSDESPLKKECAEFLTLVEGKKRDTETRIAHSLMVAKILDELR